MIITLLPAGLYTGTGEIEQTEFNSLIPFAVRWEFFAPQGSQQEALQIIELKGGEAPLENRFTFFANGELALVNSLLGKGRGKWVGGEGHLSWEVNAPPLFEGFEIIRKDPAGLFHFHAEYLSSSSRNEIRGTFSTTPAS